VVIVSAQTPTTVDGDGSVVEVHDLRKRYRASDPWAVDGVTFALEPGRAFGLLGPNGAGKSTVVKMIVGLTRPDSGSVTMFGSTPTNDAARARLGFAPEEPDFPVLFWVVRRKQV